MTQDEAFDVEYGKLLINESYAFKIQPEQSEWQCYLFGNRPGCSGIVYRPTKGRVPNFFVRWMMLICLDCLWVKDKK
jgi:hypothetical protein